MGAVSLGLTATFAIGVIQPSVVHAAASIQNVSFKAPVHTSYVHATGGGAWNDGSTTYVKGELQGTDYRCDEWASFLVLIEVPTNPDITADLKARVSVDFTLDSTGQSGVALVPDTTATHLTVNHPLATGTSIAGTHNLGGTPLDNGFEPKAEPGASISRVGGGDDPVITYYKGTFPGTAASLYESGAKARLEFTVLNLNHLLGEATKTVVRMDTQIKCNPGASPTGNLQASLVSVVADGTAGGTRPETITGGAQTVNFRGVGRLGGLDVQSVEPATFELKKSVADGDVPCPATYSGVKQLNYSSNTRVVTYCYYITNNSSVSALSVELKDDKNPAGATTALTLTGLTGGNLAAGATATARMVVTLTEFQVLTNVATATGTIDGTAETSTDSATVTLQRALASRLEITKVQTSTGPVKLGDTITYSVVATNTGEGPLDDVTVTDPNAVLSGCTPRNPVPQLMVNESIRCTASHVVTAADEAEGQVVNTAYVIAKNGGVSIEQVASSAVVTPIEKAGAVAAQKKTPKDPATGRAGDRGPGALPSTGYDTSGLLLSVWALVFGSLAIIWSGRRRRI